MIRMDIAAVAEAGYSVEDVRIEHDPSNPGFGAGCNALARGSDAGWLLFLNPDAEIVAWPWSADDPPPVGAVVGPLMVESGHPGVHSGVGYRFRDIGVGGPDFMDHSVTAGFRVKF